MIKRLKGVIRAITKKLLNMVGDIAMLTKSEFLIDNTNNTTNAEAINAYIKLWISKVKPRCLIKVLMRLCFIDNWLGIGS